MIINKNKIALWLSFVFFSGCADIDKNSHENSVQGKDKKEKINSKHEGVVIGFLEAINNGEVNIAKALVDKLSNPAVKEFANSMIQEHSKNLNETKLISVENKLAPVETIKIKTLIANTNKALDHLKILQGPALDRAYIDAMVKGHEEALNEIDEYLKWDNIPALQKHLKATREHVIHHLEMAKKAQKDLK